MTATNTRKEIIQCEARYKTTKNGVWHPLEWGSEERCRAKIDKDRIEQQPRYKNIQYRIYKKTVIEEEIYL